MKSNNYINLINTLSISISMTKELIVDLAEQDTYITLPKSISEIYMISRMKVAANILSMPIGVNEITGPSHSDIMSSHWFSKMQGNSAQSKSLSLAEWHVRNNEEGDILWCFALIHKVNLELMSESPDLSELESEAESFISTSPSFFSILGEEDNGSISAMSPEAVFSQCMGWLTLMHRKGTNK